MTASGSQARRGKRRPTRTKIVATLGPACDSVRAIRGLIKAGASIFRLNLSHGDATQHGQAIRRVRQAAKQEQRAVALLADLQGPKIRIGGLRDDEPVHLARGAAFSVVARPDVEGTAERVGCTYRRLAREVRPGERILLDDGSLELRVREVNGDEVLTRVIVGGLLRSHKGINLPGTKVQAPSLSPKDLADLALVLEHQVDFVALSFVREAADIVALREHIQATGSRAEVIAKIERPEAVRNLDAVIDVADGVMVARGDMGVELGPEAVPAIQKNIIERCIAAAKPVITATQMLESMVDNPRPTRAEASDVANAIYDGSSAIMLSAETAIGHDPTLVVRTMFRIARHTEEDIFQGIGRPARRRLADHRVGRRSHSIAEATVSAAARAALEVDARGVVVFTESGRTAKLLARERLPTRVVAVTSHADTYRRLALQWGVEPVLTRRARSVAQMQQDGEAWLLQSGWIRRGDRVVFIAGSVQVSGATNAMVIREVAVTPESGSE